MHHTKHTTRIATYQTAFYTPPLRFVCWPDASGTGQLQANLSVAGPARTGGNYDVVNWLGRRRITIGGAELPAV